ncbi:hypothetical protein [Pelagibius sp. Alg239-R121]|uniref:hypothetical protein n=1 Tax=Pelagibius sp. Alg239-R121 TaxID=2993448 RepID=UPI0024A7817B|nr:hypothetical protein [Pelagibius sp. Alg239-R121]
MRYTLVAGKETLLSFLLCVLVLVHSAVAQEDPTACTRVNSLTEIVLEHLTEDGIGTGDLAASMAVSKKTLGWRLKEAQGQLPAAFIRSIRLN